MSIIIKNLCKKYGEEVIFEDFSYVFEKGRVTGISGPSGAGKTTLLNLCSGLEKPDSGIIEGTDPTSTSYIFQEPRLLPWRTVAENLRFIFKEKSIKKKGPHDDAIRAMLELVGLKKEWDFYPHELSGGMRQRVSIARAFLHPSELLLMDEPFSSLDLNLKNKLMDDFFKIWEQDRRTVIFVSHDEKEIRRLAQVILTFSDKPVQLLNEEIL